jgi:hypothetical protein
MARHKIAGLYHVDVDVPEIGMAHVGIRVPVTVEQQP